MHDVGDEAEVAAGFAIAVDVDGLALDQAGNPLGNDGGIGAVGVLPGAEHVEVAQAHGVKAVAAGKHVGIQLVDVFGDGVGAQGFANDVFDLGQAGVVAVGAAAGGVGEAFHLGVARGRQHVQKTGDVGGVGGDGVGQAAGDAAQGGLVEDVVNSLAGLLAIGQLADVALDEVEAGPLGRRDEGLHFVEIVLVAGGEVVQADHALVQLEQGFEQVAADEAGHAGDEPGAGLLGKAGLQLLVRSHFTSLFIAACAWLVGKNIVFLLKIVSTQRLVNRDFQVDRISRRRNPTSAMCASGDVGLRLRQTRATALA